MSDKNEQRTYDLRDSTVAATEASAHNLPASSDHAAHKQQPHSQQGHSHGQGHAASRATTHTPAVHAQLATGGEVNLEHPVHPEEDHHADHAHEHGHKH